MTTTARPGERLALLSVSDKTGIVELARTLVAAGFTLLSTGGTGRALSEAGIPYRPVSAHTGAPEILGGRVKTLHPRIHGGILGHRDQHAEEAGRMDIPWIDVVVVNLYPFEAVTAGGADLATAVETIDIGGPTMVRAAAKNHRDVWVLVDPADYDRVGRALAGGEAGEGLRLELAVKAFQHTARYDAVISGWLARHAGGDPFPAEGALGLRKVQALRYGENPHQRAAFYADVEVTGRSLARVKQHQGKELSFNNLADLDAALRVVFDVTSGRAAAREIERPACAIIKHLNPCGCASAETLSEAFAAALAGDPVSAFGGIVVFNRPVAAEDVATLRKARTFFEVLGAPGYSPEALERLASRENLRVLELPGDWSAGRPPGMDARRVQGGWLLQDWDLGRETTWTVPTRRAPTAREERLLRFAWAICRNVRSNAIALACEEGDVLRLNGVGAGQMSRVDSVRLAIGKATAPVTGNALASDAFFPFPDGVEAAAAAGVSAIVQPGGSVKDAEVIAAADAAGIAMMFTGTRHFRH